MPARMRERPATVESRAPWTPPPRIPTPARRAPTRQRLCPRPRDEVGDIRMVQEVLVAIGDHRTATVPAAATDDVHGLGGERVGGAHDRADVEVVLPVLDGDVERMPVPVEVGHDRLEAPVAIAVDDVARVAVLEQLGIITGIVGPRVATAGPWTDTVLEARFRGIRLPFVLLHAATLPGTGLFGLPKSLYDFGISFSEQMANLNLETKR